MSKDSGELTQEMVDELRYSLRISVSGSNVPFVSQPGPTGRAFLPVRFFESVWTSQLTRISEHGYRKDFRV